MTDTGMNVTQADREAAVDIHNVMLHDWFTQHMLDGWEDECYVIQAFARHRETVITAAMAQDKAEHAEAMTNYRAALADCERLRMAAEAELQALKARAADALEPSGDVVDRVARAIAIADSKDGGRSLLLHNEGYMSHARILAKAAIAALGASHAE